jgi:DNA-binding NarL/FixJ family response regulator
MKKTSVLLADKHPALVESIKGLLETIYETVIMVSDEDSLIETLERFKPDLVVVDISMPVSRAQNVTMLLNEYDPELKFIVLGNDDRREVMESCKSLGASGYICKGASGRNLIAAVEKVQKGGTYFCRGLDTDASDNVVFVN